MLLELEEQVLEIYRTLDQEISNFALRTGLCCPQGCGSCCVSEKVEATVLECIPLAFELFRTNQAELLLKRLERDEDEKQCILYRQDFVDAGGWGCSQYGCRTLICRLFGFAGNINRTGNPELAMCRIMKNSVPYLHVEIEDEKAPMPLFAEAGMRITALHPSLGTKRTAINLALREALYKVGIYLELTGPETDKAAADPNHPPEAPLFPSGGMGRKAA